MCWDELAATRKELPPLFVGQPLILMGHHGIQVPHGWGLLIVQLSSTVTVPASLHRLHLSSLDVHLFPQTTISICTTSPGLYRDSSSHQHMQAWDVSIAAWDIVLAGRQWRLLCRCEYLYINYKILFGSQGSGRVCLRLLVRSSSVSLHSFRPWFSTVP